MSIRLTVNVDGVSQTMDALVDAIEHLDRPLARLGGLIAKGAKDRVDDFGPGWQDLAASTKARKADMADIVLRQRGNGARHDVARNTVRWAAGLVKSEMRVADLEARAEKGHKVGKRLEMARRRQEHYKSALQTYVGMARNAAGRAAGRRGGYADSQVTGAVRVTEINDVAALVRRAERELARRKKAGEAKREAAQYKREAKAAGTFDPETFRKIGSRSSARYQARAESTKPMGGFLNAIKTHIDPGAASVEVGSWVRYSDTHNKGGTAGHGAKIPQREYLPEANKGLTEGQMAAFQRFVDEEVTKRMR